MLSSLLPSSRVSLLLRPSLFSSRTLALGGGHADPNDVTKWIEDEWVEPIIPPLPPRGDAKPPKTYELSCALREDWQEGQRIGRRFRDDGRIPGVIFGNGPPGEESGTNMGKHHPTNKRVMVTSSHKDLQREIRVNKNPWGGNSVESRVYDLTIESDYELANYKAGDIIKVVPRHMQMHPVKNQIMSVNYLRYWPGRTLSIPLSPVNEELSNALKRGAFILKQNRHVEVNVEDGADIPDFIEVDCEGLVLKQTIRKDRLILPEGVSFAKDVREDFLVGSVFGRAKLMGDKEEEK